jgi:hypothetical protein
MIPRSLLNLRTFYFRHDRTTRWQLLLAIASAMAVAEYRMEFATRDVSVWFTRYFGYGLVALTALLFVLTAWKELRPRWPGWAGLRPHWPGLAIAAAGALFWQVHEPHDFKILFDEHVLASIARDMHFEREGAYHSFAHYVAGHFVTFWPAVDKRPLMYPFLVSVVHDLTGYRPANSFVVNGVLGFVLLLLIYAIGLAAGSQRAGYLGQLLLIGLPLLAQNATGGGFDLLNAVALCGFLLAAWNYWRQPGTGGLNLCVFTALVLANVRYESLLYLGLFGLLIVGKWVREQRLTLTWELALAPIFALPPVLINLIFYSNAGNFQTEEQNFINVSHLPDNLAHALYFLFTPSFEINNSVLLSSVGSVTLIITLVVVIRRLVPYFRQARFEIPLVLTLAGVLTNTLLSLMLSWGHWEDPAVTRFSIPLQIAFAWCAMYVAAQWRPGRALPGWVLGFTGIYAIVAAAPVSSEAYMTNEHNTYVTYHWAQQYVTTHADKSVLIVTRADLLFTLYGYPNIPIGLANRVPEKVVNTVRLGLYRDVWAIQELMLNQKLNAWVEMPTARLDRRLVLQTIAEYPLGPEARVRISRIVAFDPKRPAGTVVLRGELPATGSNATSDTFMFEYTGSALRTENILTARPEGEPPAIPSLSELPKNADDMDNMIYQQYPL